MYPDIATDASNYARYVAGIDALRFGVRTSEIKLEQLTYLPKHEKKSIIELGPYIDVYLGETRVYKCTSRTLLFASCTDIGRFLEPVHGRLSVRLPQGLTSVLVVKLAVLYREQYLLDTRVQDAPWKVNNDFALHISLSELFAYIGMPAAALKVEMRIVRRAQERPLRMHQISGIWMREDRERPSRYAEAMADNILTFTPISEVERFLAELEVEMIVPAGTSGHNVRNEMRQLERFLESPANDALMRLIWTGNILLAVEPLKAPVWIEIGVVQYKGYRREYRRGLRKVVLKTADDVGL